MRWRPEAARRVIRPWPISPPAPVMRTTGLRSMGGFQRSPRAPRASSSWSTSVSSSVADGADRRRIREVDARALQQRHRVVAPTGREQVQVARDGLLPGRRVGVAQPDQQAGARRVTRGVLIDIVRRAEEMRDACPRHPRQRVVVDRVAVVGAQRRVVQRAEDVGGDRLPRLDETMRLQFPIGKHHLREERAGDAVDGVLQQHDALERVGRVREPVIEQQRFAQRRRHLGDEDGVVRVHEWLALVRQHRVHRVPHLVREREGGIERVVVVHEHVRMHAVHRCRVGTRALAVVLVDVHPTPLEAGGEALLVLPAERRDRCDDPLHHLLVRVVLGEVHQRNRPVVEVIRLELEGAAPQLLVALEGRDVGARRGNQVLDDGDGDVVAVEGGLERRCVAAGTRLVPVALQHAVVERRVGIERGLEGAVVGLEGAGAIGLHAVGGQQRAVARIGDLHLSRRCSARSSESACPLSTAPRTHRRERA